MAKWKNWARTVRHSDLQKVFRPDNLRELKSNVKEAARKGWKLRAVGSGHAWSNLGVPARCRGAVIRTDKLAEFTLLSEKLVEVQGGIKIRRLNNKLFKQGLALENMGDANPQAIAGAIATETHGSGVNLGSLSEFVEGMTIVKANGEEHVLKGQELKAGRVSLGQLGVVCSIKLGVRKNYYLHHHQQLVTLKNENLKELLKNRHLEYWLYPYTGKAERIIRNEVDSTKVINPLDLLEEWFIKIGAKLVDGIGRSHPERLPAFWKEHLRPKYFPEFERQGPWHKILLGKSNVWHDVVRTFTMEYQFELGANFENFWGAVGDLEQSIELARRKCVFVASPIQIRFTKKSERSLLSHLCSQPTASFSISFFRNHEGAHTWLPELEEKLIARGAKPHWGKMYYKKPKKPAAFERIRKKLDPNGVFGFEQGLYTPDAEAFQDP